MVTVSFGVSDLYLGLFQAALGQIFLFSPLSQGFERP
jgi:hypothetical protein